jgi:cytochrome d ubiquinol oxidase subunit I
VVQGIDSVTPEDRPPLAIVHLAFQIMVACGTVMATLALFGAWRWWQRRRGRGVALPDDRRFLLALVMAAPLGFIALEAGWTVTEVGRQPWIVQGVMRTAEAVTPMPGLGITFALFSVLYIGLAIAVVFLLWRQILKTGVTLIPLGVTSELPIPSRVTGAVPAPKS